MDPAARSGHHRAARVHPQPEGAISPERKEWPLQLIGHHYKQRTHSTYGNCWWLQEVAPQELLDQPHRREARASNSGIV